VYEKQENYSVTVTSGSNRVVSIASAPRISPMISTCHQPIMTTATITTHAAVSLCTLKKMLDSLINFIVKVRLKYTWSVNLC
jgi:hypothetical protein